MAAMILFLLVLTQMTFFTVEQIQDSSSQAISFNQSKAAKTISNGLLSTPGNPEYWESLRRSSFPNDFILGIAGNNFGEVDAAKIGRLYLESPINWRLSYNDLVMSGNQVFREWDLELKFYQLVKIKLTNVAFASATATTINVEGIVTYNSYPASNVNVYVIGVGNPSQIGNKLTTTAVTGSDGKFSAVLTGASQDIYVITVLVKISSELQGSAWSELTRPGATNPTEVTSIITHSLTSTTILPEETVIMDHSVSSVTQSTHWVIYLTENTLYVHTYSGTLVASGTEWQANINLPSNGMAVVVNFGRHVDSGAGVDDITSYSVRSYPQPINDDYVTPLTPLVTSPEQYTFTKIVYSRGVLLVMEVSLWQK